VIAISSIIVAISAGRGIPSSSVTVQIHANFRFNEVETSQRNRERKERAKFCQKESQMERMKMRELSDDAVSPREGSTWVAWAVRVNASPFYF